MDPLPIPEWDASLKTVLDDTSGRPLNIHSLMANHPRLLKAWWNLRNYSVNGGDLQQRECELVILRVAVHMRTWYEWASHVQRSLACGLSLEEIERVRQGPADAGWQERDALLLTVVDELLADRQVTDDTRQSFERLYSANQLMDVMAIHALYIAIACMINTWGLELDEHIEKQLPPQMTRDELFR